MSLFLHHVGEEGANADFPKTVIKLDGTLVQRTFSELRNHMPEFDSPAQEHFKQEAESDGHKAFQIWGIPSGGERMLRSLAKGDQFLLLPSQKLGSTITYAGRVVARAPRKSFALSQFLWGSEKFPIIFLMTGQPIDYSWEKLFHEIGFKPNYQLRGNAIRITDERIRNSKFGNEPSLLRAMGIDVDARYISLEPLVDDFITDLSILLNDTTLDDTERESLIKARLGQGEFRAAVLAQWNNECAVTGCKTIEALRASHIKPWRSCDPKERLDPSNGLCLVANIDALFDRYLITFSDDGLIRWSSTVSIKERKILLQGFKGTRMQFSKGQRRYLAHHRENFEAFNQ